MFMDIICPLLFIIALFLVALFSQAVKSKEIFPILICFTTKGQCVETVNKFMTSCGICTWNDRTV